MLSKRAVYNFKIAEAKLENRGSKVLKGGKSYFS